MRNIYANQISNKPNSRPDKINKQNMEMNEKGNVKRKNETTKDELSRYIPS